MPTKVHLVKAMFFPAVIYRCENWNIKKTECWRIDAFELWCWRRLLRVPLDCKEIQTVHPKGDQSWLFIGKTDVKAEAPILWPPDWEQEEKGTTEDEMVGWHHRLNEHEFEQTPGDGEGQENLVAAVHGVAKSQKRLSDWTNAMPMGCQNAG